MAIDPSTHPSYFTAMKNKLATAGILATCHCGAVTISLAARPTEITECNCSLCKSYGVLWAYYYTDDIVVTPNPPPTETYAWNGKNVDFHRCKNCGCVTHWTPRNPKRDRRGINARLLPSDVLAAARLRHRDGAFTGKYLD
jgi:hypothetical protein